jgi:hypothetical protein
VHSGVIAPDSVSILEFPAAVERRGWEEGKAVVLFPSAEAVSLYDMPPSELEAIETLVLIDSRWNNTGKVRSTPQYSCFG